MWSLISRKVHLIGRSVFDSQMVSGRASYLVANETLVVSDMFGALGGGEVDPVYVHCHWVFGLFGS